jgi:LDH2 family malate/lactate/ureidoglycolate dehydrogenase
LSCPQAGGRRALSLIQLPSASAKRDFPIILDIATSGIALNKARVAHLRGKPVEPGYIVDAEGQPTTDPGVLFQEPRGALLPFGLHKGSGLAVVGELLAGALSGGRTIAPHNARDGSTINNMLSVVIDPHHITSGAWHQEAEAMIAYLQDCPPADPEEPVRAPGEPEAIARRCAEAEGITYDDATWGTLAELAEGLGLNSPHKGQELRRPARSVTALRKAPSYSAGNTASVRHEQGHWAGLQERLRHAAEDHLA